MEWDAQRGPGRRQGPAERPAAVRGPSLAVIPSRSETSETFRVIQSRSESFRGRKRQGRGREMDGGSIGCGRLGCMMRPLRVAPIYFWPARIRRERPGMARNGTEWHGTVASVTEWPERTRNGRAGARGRWARKSRLRGPSWTPGRVLPAPLCRVRAGPAWPSMTRNDSDHSFRVTARPRARWPARPGPGLHRLRRPGGLAALSGPGLGAGLGHSTEAGPADAMTLTLAET